MFFSYEDFLSECFVEDVREARTLETSVKLHPVETEEWLNYDDDPQLSSQLLQSFNLNFGQSG